MAFRSINAQLAGMIASLLEDNGRWMLRSFFLRQSVRIVGGDEPTILARMAGDKSPERTADSSPGRGIARLPSCGFRALHGG